MSKTSLLTKILKGIQTAQDILALLDTMIDTDRLVGLSKSLGPSAKDFKLRHSEMLDELENEFRSTSKTRKKASAS